MKKHTLLTTIILFIISLNLAGQTFEEYKKQKEVEFEAYKQKQAEFIQQMQKEFDEYVKQQDQAFAEFLKQAWSPHAIQEAKPIPKIPEPPVEPRFVASKDTVPKGLTKHLKNPLMRIENGKEIPVIPPTIKKSTKESAAGLPVDFSFYGSNIKILPDKNMILDPPDSKNEESIGEYWSAFCKTNYGAVLSALQNYKDVMNLNDWGYYLLINRFSSKVYPASATGAELMTWALLNRSGYKVRLGLVNNDICLLLPTYQTLYGRNYLKIDGLNYYVLKDLNGEKIHTYDQDYTSSMRVFDFNLPEPLNLDVSPESRKLSFEFQGKPYVFDLDYNKNVVDFYREYPQVNLEIYFNAAVTPVTKESALRAITDVISPMTEVESVNFLLHFVQNAFRYQIDDQQFGNEKFLFPEETIFYPASDCEDRSILFAFLVKELLNKKVIGLEYPEHVSTAVHLDRDVEGDKIVFDKESYVIADATYANAPLGLSIPDYREKESRVIALNNNNYYKNREQSYWALTMKQGGFRGDVLQDIIFDQSGNAYLAGYFQKSALFGEYTLGTRNDEPDSRGAFILKYNGDQQVQWAKDIAGSRNVTAYSIAMDNNGDLYVLGSFSGDIDPGRGLPSISCKENMNDVFLLKISKDGDFKWIKKAGLDTYPQDNYFTYRIDFTPDGQNTGTTLYSESEFYKDYGLHVDAGDMINVTGSFSNSTGFVNTMLSLKPAAEKSFNVPESLKTENDKLISESCEKTIAGVFSVINHVKLDGFKLLGTDAQKTLDQYNPVFKEEYPDIYESIGKINFVINNDGIVTLETTDGSNVLIRELKLKNNATMKVIPYEDGNARVDIMNGVQVGKFFIWFNLNFVKMFKTNGDILFDYDKDHSQRVMNLKEDILD